MLFLHLRTKRPSPSHNENFIQRFARGVLLGGLAALVVWLFWSNVGDRIGGVRQDAVVRDEMNLISDTDRRQFGQLSLAFEKNFGVSLSIRILRGAMPPMVREPSLTTISVNMYPEHNAARLELPPLVRAAVGEALRRELDQYLAQGMESGHLVEGLVGTLQIIWEIIAEGP
jgi:hypothetical protein